jgi:tetratricopeptide (TPR) repeat protein
VVVVDRERGTRRWPVDVVRAAVRLRPRTLTIKEKRAFSVWAPAEEAALARVEALFEELVAARDVIDRLQADASLSPAVRRAAIDLARRQQDDPLLLARIAVRATAPPRESPGAYLRYLRLAEAAVRLDPECGPRLEYAIAVCCVRTGAARRAVALLEQALARAEKSRRRARPEILAYLAMALLGIDDRPKAERALQEARRINQGSDVESIGTWCETLFHEVEGILESRN